MSLGAHRSTRPCVTRATLLCSTWHTLLLPVLLLLLLLLLLDDDDDDDDVETDVVDDADDDDDDAEEEEPSYQTMSHVCHHRDYLRW